MELKAIYPFIFQIRFSFGSTIVSISPKSKALLHLRYCIKLRISTSGTYPQIHFLSKISIYKTHHRGIQNSAKHLRWSIFRENNKLNALFQPCAAYKSSSKEKAYRYHLIISYNSYCRNYPIISSSVLHLFIVTPGLAKMLTCISRALREKSPNTEFFLVRIFLYSVRTQENTDKKKPRIWTLFTQWSIYIKITYGKKKKRAYLL